MKRFFQVLGILILLLLAALFFLPIIFKDEIISRAKQEINNNLTATVDFNDIDISLFRSFPDFSMDIENVIVTGQGDFEGVHLAEIENFRVDLALFSVISGNKFEVEAINIDNADIYFLILEDGQMNYDIAKPTDTAPGDTVPPASSNFQLTLKEYSIDGGNFIYEDRALGMKLLAKDFQHAGTGDFTEEVFKLDTDTEIQMFTLNYDGVNYIENAHVMGDMIFEFNQPEFRITFMENELFLNELKLNFDGFIAMPSDDVKMNLSFNSPDSDFKNILSLVPSVYSEDFANIKTSGTFNFNGKVDGVYNAENESYPTFDINMQIADGTFKYPNLPADVKDINLKANIVSRTTDLNAMEINVPVARANVGGSPVDARLNLKNTMVDPVFDVYLKTNMQLENLSKVMPAEGFAYKGNIKADVEMAGTMSDIEAENYENVKAQGQLLATNIDLRNDSLPYPVLIPTMQMDFAPEKVSLNSFEAKFGNSDVSANGSILNLMSYMLNDKLLKGEFSVNSKLLDLNQLSSGEEEGTTAQSGEGTSGGTTDTSAMDVIRIPENLDFIVNAKVDKLLYDDLEVNNVTGAVKLKEGKAQLENMVMEMLGGSMALSGAYDSKPDAPLVDMNFKINNFGFAESFAKLDMLKSIAPIMENTMGTFSTGFSFSSLLNPDMSPDLSSILSSGSLTSSGLVTSPKVLEKLSSLLQNPNLSSLNIGNVNLSFKVADGRVNVDPFDINAGDVSAVVSGSNGLDKTLDYVMAMKIPVSNIKANNLLDKIGASQGGKVEMAVKITGTYDNPQISTSLGDLFGNVVDNIKDKINEKKQEAVDKVNAKAQEYLDAASAKGDQLIAAAKEQADRIRAMAQTQADNLISQADTRATKLEDEAKGNMLKEKGASIAANKIRSEAKKSADEIMNTANKKANDLVNKAEQQKQKLIDEAREKGKIENQ